MNDKSNTLIPRYPLEIEIMEETHMSYKVHAKNQYCPIRVSITYNDTKQKNQPRGDVKVYVSFTNKDPSEADCLRSFVNVNIILYLIYLAW